MQIFLAHSCRSGHCFRCFYTNDDDDDAAEKYLHAGRGRRRNVNAATVFSNVSTAKRVKRKERGRGGRGNMRKNNNAITRSDVSRSVQNGSINTQ